MFKALNKDKILRVIHMWISCDNKNDAFNTRVGCIFVILSGV